MMGKAVPFFLVASIGVTMSSLLTDRYRVDFYSQEERSFSLFEFDRFEEERLFTIQNMKKKEAEVRKLRRQKKKLEALIASTDEGDTISI